VPDITRKTSRDKLESRREPYWLRLGKGCALGFRRGPDTWVARFTKKDASKLYKALDGITEYDQAKKAAEDWLSQLAGSPIRAPKRATVRAALEAYLADLKRHGRAEAAEEAEARFKLIVYKDPIAELNLESATKDDFMEWRDRMTEGRQARSLNRHVRSVVAGLTRARDLGHVGNPDAWKLRPLADDVEDEGDTAVFLTAEQRKAIIEAAPQYLGDFLHALEHTGARPKEITSATASDFDGQTLRLAHRKGRPPKLRVRHVVLAAAGVEFFKSMSRRKLPAALLFTEDGEQQWRRHVWAREFRAAVVEVNKHAKGNARIPADASAYSFRHARISELLQLHGVDPLTVAAQTGTSVAMIERNYLRFIPSAMRDKLAAIKEAG
jgi:integrase